MYKFVLVQCPDGSLGGKKKNHIPFNLSVSLIGVDVGNTSTRISRFANYLRNLLPSSDVSVMEMAAKAVGKLALASGTYTAEYVEFEVKRAFEWLTGDRNEGRRHAAVSVTAHFVLLSTKYSQNL